MTYTLLGVIFLSSFVEVFLKALQQQNVTYGNRKWIPVVSHGMAATDIFLIVTVAITGHSIWALVGLWLCRANGAWLGTFTAMWLHKRMGLQA